MNICSGKRGDPSAESQKTEIKRRREGSFLRSIKGLALRSKEGHYSLKRGEKPWLASALAHREQRASGLCRRARKEGNLFRKEEEAIMLFLAEEKTTTNN